MTQVGELDLDSGEFGPPEETEELTTQQSNNIMALLVNKALQPEPSKIEPYMLEVDKRMDIAQYYREVLKAPLFGDPCDASEIVEREIRDFIRSRLEVLFGIKATTIEVVKSPFTEQEVTTLKALAKLTDNELTTLNLILAKVLGSSKTEPSVTPVAAPASKPTPTLIPRQKTPSAVATISTPTTAVATPTPPKRKPGRPPATIQVEDPNTGEVIEMRAPKMQAIKNPNALAMPTGAGMHMATAIAAQRSASAISRKANSAMDTGNDFHPTV